MTGKRKRSYAGKVESSTQKKRKTTQVKDKDLILPKDPIEFAYAKTYTPAQLLNIPWADRWKLNLENRDFPRNDDGEPDELELERKDSAWRITWLVHYGCQAGEEDRIFFYSHTERYGGPFAFLSNFYPCRFRVSDMADGHDFDCLEQFYQYKKAVRMREMSKMSSNLSEDHIASLEQLPDLVLATKNDPIQCADVVRKFSYLEDEDSAWWSVWSDYWNAERYSVLKEGIQAKFDDERNKGLRNLLMMTGDFRLIEAHASCSTGIGIPILEAVKGTKKWAANLLGEALMETRAALRAAHQGQPLPGYAYLFWRLWEEMLNEVRYTSIRKLRSAKELLEWKAKLPELPQLTTKIVKPELEKFRDSWSTTPVESKLIHQMLKNHQEQGQQEG